MSVTCPKCGEVYMKPKRRRITVVSERQTHNGFVSFELSDGGRAHIPYDQIKRLYNEEQDRIDALLNSAASEVRDRGEK